MLELRSHGSKLPSIDLKSSLDYSQRKSTRTPGLRGRQKSYSTRILYFGALLALMVTIVAGLSVNRLMAAQAVNFEQALAVAMQFSGDPIFLAP